MVQNYDFELKMPPTHYAPGNNMTCCNSSIYILEHSRVLSFLTSVSLMRFLNLSSFVQIFHLNLNHHVLHKWTNAISHYSHGNKGNPVTTSDHLLNVVNFSMIFL